VHGNYYSIIIFLFIDVITHEVKAIYKIRKEKMETHTDKTEK
jgi:hypothetical protein